MSGLESVLVKGWEQVCVDSGKYESLHNFGCRRVARLADMKFLEKCPCGFKDRDDNR